MVIHSSDLKKYRYFASLSDSSLESMSAKIEIVKFPRGAEIIKEGDIGDFFYFVAEGRLDVTITTKSGQVAKLAVLSSGQGFGEMALLTGSTRFCTVQATTNVTLYRLPKRDFEEIVGREPAFRKMLLRKAEEYSGYNKIKALQPFALLEPDKMFAILARMTEKTFSLGEDIIVQGEKGDFYYIVKSGRVAVLQKKKGEREVGQVAMLGEGDGFGEEALIREGPRNATCRAVEETIVYALDKVDFKEVLQASFLENIVSEDIFPDTYLDKYVLLDVRSPGEYKEERIAGAVNIPIDIIRRKFGELDKAAQYVTYSMNSARGKVAAFLLKNHGFNAKCLQGGLNTWPGPVLKTGTEGPEGTDNACALRFKNKK